LNLTQQLQELNNITFENCGSPRASIAIGGTTNNKDITKLFDLLNQKDTALVKLQKRLAKFKTEQFARKVHRKRSLETRTPLSFIDDNINERFYGQKRSVSPCCLGDERVNPSPSTSTCGDSGSRSNSFSFIIEKQQSLIKNMAHVINLHQNYENIPTERTDDLEFVEAVIERVQQQTVSNEQNEDIQYNITQSGLSQEIGFSPSEFQEEHKVHGFE